VPYVTGHGGTNVVVPVVVVPVVVVPVPVVVGAVDEDGKELHVRPLTTYWVM
jgi:hypothetical protein